MSDGDDKGERPKKSWREIDAARDRSNQRREKPGEPAARGAGAARASKQYRAALDALFDKGEIGKVARKLGAPAAAPSASTPAPAADPSHRAALRKKILEAIGRDEVTRAVDRYLQEHPLPDDFEVLEQAIEHRKSERTIEALRALESLLEREQPKRSRALAAKLRFLVETSGDSDVVAAAERARARLK